MLKRFLACLLIAVMMITTFTACNIGSDDDVEETEKEATKKPSKKTETDEDEEEEEDEDIEESDEETEDLDESEEEDDESEEDEVTEYTESEDVTDDSESEEATDDADSEEITEDSESEENTEALESEENTEESEVETKDKVTQNKPDDEEEKDESDKDDGILKILTIGNSFSDDTMQYMYQIAQSAGVSKIKLGNLYIGGCTLDTHANNAKNDNASYEYRVNNEETNGAWVTTKNYKMSDAIKSENWDYISLQQASGSSGVANTYTELEYMIGYVQALCPDATLVWNMTWAYQQNSGHSEFSKYGKNQMTMYDSIIYAVGKNVVTNDKISIVVPNGTAIQNARTSYVGDTLTRDGYHLSLDLGRYIAGLTFFHGVTRISIENIEYKPTGVDENLQKIAIESAMNAVDEPYKVTKSEYVSAPVGESDVYTKLDLGWTALAYWNSGESGEKGNNLETEKNNRINFYATKKFTKEELPVGSVIVVADGWKYRPEGWNYNGTARPGEVTDRIVVVTEAWWSSYETRAFNLSKADSSSLEGKSQADIDSVFAIYVPIEDKTAVTEYKELDLGWTSLAYWNSPASTEMDTTSSNHVSFYATKKFTKSELPIGSIIVLADGWKYRPEGWAYNGSSRPGEVTTQIIMVTEEWWSSYETRAFNLSKTGNPSLASVSQSEIDAAFVIYIPKK